MITKKKSLKSNLDIHKVKRKQLSIQFSLDGFSFSVFDIELHEYIAFSKYAFKSKRKTPDELLENIKQVFNKEELLLNKFEKVFIIHVNNLSSFVPLALFDENNLDTYVKFNTKIYDSDFFVYDFIKNQDMVSVFAPYVNINNFLIDQFGSFTYKHYSSILVESLLNNYAGKSDTILYINIANSHFEIIVSKNKKLLLYNTFEYQSTQDFIYYVLFTMEQLKLDVETVKVELLGETSNNDELFNILYKYIRDVSLIDYKPKFNSILSINDKVKKENFALFNAIE